MGLVEGMTRSSGQRTSKTVLMSPNKKYTNGAARTRNGRYRGRMESLEVDWPLAQSFGAMQVGVMEFTNEQ